MKVNTRALQKYKTPILFLLSCCAFYFSFAYDLQRSDFIKLSGLYIALFFLSWKLMKTTFLSWQFLFAAGIVFRLLFLFSIPHLSQDFYRFVWDGKILLHGINPYDFSPNELVASQQLSFNFKNLIKGMGTLSAGNHSNYPPLHQLIFVISVFFSGKSILGAVITMRLLIISAEIGIFYLARKLLKTLQLPKNRIFWYFLNPLVIIELSGNLHFESFMIFFLVSALLLLQKKRYFWSALLFSCAISVKLIPLLLLPLLGHFLLKNTQKGGLDSKTRGKNWKLLLLYYFGIAGFTGLSFLLFLSKESFWNFLKTLNLWFQNFEFNASIYYLIRWIGFQLVNYNIIQYAGPLLGIVIIFIVLKLSLFRKNQEMNTLLVNMLLALSAYYFLATTVHPWYLILLIFLNIFSNYKFVWAWSLLVILSYSAYSAPGFQERYWLLAIEYLPVFYLLGKEVFVNKKNAPAVSQS